MIQRITLLAAFISLFTTLTTAQRPGGGGRNGGGQEPRSGRFYGTLIDANSGKKVEYASVQLIGMTWDSVSKSKREKVLAGQLTGENGEFNLEQIPVLAISPLKPLVLVTKTTKAKSVLVFKEENGPTRPN